MGERETTRCPPDACLRDDGFMCGGADECEIADGLYAPPSGPDLRSHADAFHAGTLARAMAKPVSANPHPHGSPDRLAWDAGWKLPDTAREQETQDAG